MTEKMLFYSPEETADEPQPFILGGVDGPMSEEGYLTILPDTDVGSAAKERVKLCGCDDCDRVRAA